MTILSERTGLLTFQPAHWSPHRIDGMAGIVLLDKEQQRALGVLSHRQPDSPSTSSQHSYLKRSHGSVDRLSPRTDFTTRTTRMTDMSSNEGGHRSAHLRSGDGHITSFSSEKSKLRSSAGATVVADGRSSAYNMPFIGEAYGDSYPILRDDEARSSTGSVNGEYTGAGHKKRISEWWILLGVLLGIALGAVCSNQQLSADATRWINLPGELFLRVLKCLIVPYVFCSVAVAVGDIVFVGKGSIIGWQTAKVMALFWVATVVMGVGIALAFRPVFRDIGISTEARINSMGFTCGNGLQAAMTKNGSIICSGNPLTVTDDTIFTVVDINKSFSSARSGIVALTLSEELMHMITPIVSNNLIKSFAQNELLSIITFSMALGAIAGRSYFSKSRRVNYLYLTMLQLRNTFFLMMEWTISFTPFAVVSMIAGSFAAHPEFGKIFELTYPYLLVTFLASFLQTVVIYPLIMFLKTGCQPYRHMRGMSHAYLFGFACASSLASMPVTLSCVKTARMCSQSITNFVISIGVVSSVSGMGFYLPIAVVFIAEASGDGEKITALRIVGLAILSILACAGTPPIPSAGLAVISTAYMTLFGHVHSGTFAYVVAMDFILDRVVTACSVNDDIIALKIIAETTDETVVQDRLGERY